MLPLTGGKNILEEIVMRKKVLPLTGGKNSGGNSE